MYGKYKLFYISPKNWGDYVHVQTVCTRALLGGDLGTRLGGQLHGGPGKNTKLSKLGGGRLRGYGRLPGTIQYSCLFKITICCLWRQTLLIKDPVRYTVDWSCQVLATGKVRGLHVQITLSSYRIHVAITQSLDWLHNLEIEM